jgi:hypothetical protein
MKNIINPKIADMNKEYIITFLQEYSHYIKSLEKMRKHIGLEHTNIYCPTEFFKQTFLNILKDTDEYEEAFKVFK